MKFRFISDPLDPLSDLSTGGNEAGSVPSSFHPAAGHGGGSPSVSTPPVILPAPVPVVPAEAVAAQSVQNGPGGPGSIVSEASPTGMTINLAFDAAAMASTTAAANFRAGIEQAASMLSATITDKITVNIAIDYSGTGGGAAAGPDNGLFVDYSTVRAQLVNNTTRGDPTFNALPTGSAIQGQSSVAVWNAQLKLWSSSLSSTISGVPGANDTSTDDGSATFATDINPNLLVGVALHELTHALGRVPFGSQPDLFDFYRFTSAGTQLFANGNTAPAAYFSVDGGFTKIADYGQTSDPSDFLNSGVQGRTDPFNEFYNNSTFQSLTAADKEQLDALGFHLASPLTTTIQTDTNSIASTSLVQFFNNYYLQNPGTGAGPELKFGGTPVVPGAGQFSGWAAIGAVQTSTGYDVAWKDAATNQYAVWTTDSSGNFVSSTGAIAGTSTTLVAFETAFHQDLNGDGVIGIPGTVIQTDGSTSLVQVGSNYFLDPVGGSSGPELKFGGAPVVAGQFSGWAPLGAVQTSTGYDMAWKDATTNQYAVWTTDSSGNFVSSTGAIAATSTVLESLETTFQQDLNSDGVIGIPSKVIQTDGSTSLVQVGSNYFLDPVGGSSGPELKFGGAAFVVDGGQFSGWAGIGAVQTSTGYDVAWKNAATNQYAVWTTDSSGNFVSSTGAISGTSTALESLETTFQQDLNSDGVIGIPSKVIQTDGSTSLVQVGSNYFLDPVGGSSGPELKFGGAAFVVDAGQFSGWAGIGAVQTSTGYDVAWKNAATNQYAVWTTDSSGNFVSSTGAIAGTSTTLETYETTFHQDLNGDGIIGIPPAPVRSATSSSTVSPAVSVKVASNDTFVFGWNSGVGDVASNPAMMGHDTSVVGGHLAPCVHEAPSSGWQAQISSMIEGHDAIINTGNHDSSAAVNIHLADLHASHFIFG
jgi:serralysin